MQSPGTINLLLYVIVSGLQADKLTRQLAQNNFYFTKIDSSGGIIQEPMVCLLIGLDTARKPALIDLVNECCRPYRHYIPTQMAPQPGYAELPMIEAQLGGAIIYSMNVERFEQF
ncbi:MAG: cyclic-di-AMP receptor [Anaerolineae bacterium]|nr:cyclic-di-AMP receptor [Anaerolineae bacterium]